MSPLLRFGELNFRIFSVCAPPPPPPPPRLEFAYYLHPTDTRAYYLHPTDTRAYYLHPTDTRAIFLDKDFLCNDMCSVTGRCLTYGGGGGG